MMLKVPGYLHLELRYLLQCLKHLRWCLIDLHKLKATHTQTNLPKLDELLACVKIHHKLRRQFDSECTATSQVEGSTHIIDLK